MKRRVWIKRKDRVRQRYWKGYSYFVAARKTEADELVAVQKFGAKNLKNLKKLGEGRDRVVLALDKDKVIKIAKNPAGLAQNALESDLGSGYFDENAIDVHEVGKDYVVMERADRDDSKIKKFLRPLKTITQMDVDRTTSQYQDAMHKIGREDLLNYDIAINDLKRPSSWGIKKGRPVIIDAGVLSKASLKKDAHEFDKNQWREVQMLRRRYK